MGCGKSKLSNIDINTLKPFLQGKCIKCKIVEVNNFYTYKVLFYYNKNYLTWNCRFSEYYKELIEDSDAQMTYIIKKNDELFMFIHGLKENYLVIDFYKKKKDKRTLNSIIVEEIHKGYFSRVYKKSFKNKINNNISDCNIIDPNIINTTISAKNAPNMKINITPDKKKNCGTYKKKPNSFIEELKSKQKIIE